MYVRLPQDLEDLIARKVEAGEYETAIDVLIHAVYLLDAHDRMRQEQLKALRVEISIGIAVRARRDQAFHETKRQSEAASG